MEKLILKTEKLSKTFSTAGVQQHVLKNLDVEIYENDFTVIMGSSGGGKSTLLYALSGMDTPTLGNVNYIINNDEYGIAKLNQDELSLFRRKTCGFVFQQIYLIDSMSILDNVIMCGLLVNKDKKQVIEASKKALLSVGLEEILWNKFPNQLSGGEAQRAGVARAIVNNPKILFADEPTGALNSKNANMVLDVFTSINESGQSVVMVTHDITSALRGNRILYLRDGIIEGELRLDKYTSEDDTRKEKIRTFLVNMGW